MNLDPFGDPFRLNSGSSTSDLFKKPLTGAARPRPKEKPPEEAEAEAEPLDDGSGEDEAVEEAAKEEAGEKVVLQNPKWEVDQVGFNEETEVSVEAELPESQAHKTKVDFELFAKIPEGDDPVGGKESISKAQGSIDGGKAKAKVPVYIPQYKDGSGSPLTKVEYYFTAKHSASDILEDKAASKVIDSMADREIESLVLEDVTFTTDKSFVRAQQTGALKELTAAIKGWKEKNPDGKLAVFGHADAVGKEDHNKKLSEKRATAVFALLVKDPAPWKSLYNEEKWGLASTQEYLKHLGHDPGAIDGQDGPNTQKAVKSFQKSVGMTESGTADEATREKLYLAFMKDCNAETIAAKDFDAIDGKPHTGCSEFNLIEKTQGASEKNRRVAVFFLKSNKNFPIQYPCKHGDIGPCKKQVARKGERRTPGFTCLFYDQLIKEEKKGGGGGGGATGGKVKAFLHSKEKELKRIVNLKGKPDLGPEFTLEVEVEAGVKKVFWKATAGVKNSKRNDPVPGFIDPVSKKATALKDGVGEFESEVKEGKSKAVFHLGLAGGDEFSFEVAAEKGKKELEQKVNTARKVWTQITLEKGMALPALTNFITAYDLANVEVVRTKDVEFEKKDAPARTFYPEWMISPGGSDKEVAVIGSHNKAHYQALLKDVEGESPKAHMVICQHQWDEGDPSEPLEEILTTRTSINLSAVVSVFKPALSGNLVISGTWKSMAPVGHADHGKSGALTDADIIIDKNRSSLDEYMVKLPAEAPEPSVTNKVKVQLKLQGANGPFLGESDGKQILAVYDPADPTDFQNTLTHEMGHAYNQTPGSGDQSPGLEAHPHYYIKHGGIGPHCSTILKDGNEAKGVEVDGKDDLGKTIKVYKTGVCVMFHSGPQPGCLNRYCDTCAPYVKATDFADFGKA